MLFDFNDHFSFVIFPDLVFPILPAAPSSLEETVIIGGGTTSVSVAITGTLDQSEG